MKFIDLFAGLGGFHVGLANNGHECVFACEIETELRNLYKSNYGIQPFDDVTKIDVTKIPSHEIICAGFPCQPFSLAGQKKGAECPKSGKLIEHVIRIAEFHNPQFILLENVPNIVTIANGTFWSYLTNSFKNIGYKIYHKIISPVDIGIPQNRKRIFIVAVRQDIDNGNFNWPDTTQLKNIDLSEILDKSNIHKHLESKKTMLLKHWQKLLNQLSISELRSTSLVAPEFGATYPHDFQQISFEEMKKYKGAYGQDLSNCNSWDEIMEKLPSYTNKYFKIPDWLVKSALKSRELFSQNANICTKWVAELDKKNNSWQILEWRGNFNDLNIYNHLVQFRASGIRILRPNVAPSLISMTPTQIPIIPAEDRYLSPYEAAKLQNLHKLHQLPQGTVKAFKALGNAVNAKIVEFITKNLNIDYGILN
ncbi:DNA-cytosine methyltransferase [Snodgrassella communis]|jgi:DNA (cytosine-5)-methyltransferase 1|uniref:DNA cytosine methyltransferase n=1 Tax=Snodgrassella communis TaxID=2946699 RepID=UPI000460CF5D|nr:DNA (cytosine-5-)-methyltransferase [Snodgrassella communis]KDN13512.1 DNA-cytosine methyltransferase [Snodgrassella communis]